MSSLAAIIANQGSPVAGTIHSFAGSSAPSGWLLCDGSAISRTTYAALFSSIGSAYGAGDGSTTFNLPTTSGIFLRAAGSQTVSSKSFDGGSIGAKTKHKTAINGLTAATSSTPAATLNNTNLAHTHSLTDYYGQVSSRNNGSTSDTSVSASNTTASQADNTSSSLGNHTHTPTYSVSHATTLSSTDTETAPAALSLNFIIKA